MKDPEFDSYAQNYGDIVKKAASIIPVENEFYLTSKIKILSQIIENLPTNAYVLDFGCGVGSLVIPLSKLFPEKTFFAYDPSPESIEKIKQENIKNIVCLTSEDELSKLSSSAKIDFIFCINVFHHIDKDTRSDKVSLLRTLLSHQGQILILEHNPLNPVTRIVVNRCEFDIGVELLSAHEMKELFQANFIEVQKHRYIIFFPFDNKFFNKLEKLLSRLPMGAQQYILGKVN